MAAETVLLAAATATGVGIAKAFNRLVDKHVFQVVTTGDPTAVTILLEGSLDGTNFDIIGTHAFTAADIVNDGAIFFDVDSPCLHVRLNLTVLTAGTSPTITAIYEGMQTGDHQSGLHGVT
tara:strand:+ start:2545 stop:2907 length:363 start_codon:yes stop_codon:yes gene_type:complete